MNYYLLTAFGPDRPGLVAQVTQAVYQAGGNIEDTSMTRLGGEFTMMLVIGLAATASTRFEKALPLLQKKTGLILNAKRIATAQALKPTRSAATHLISIYGADRPGIVYKITQLLADQRVNITDLNTKALQRSNKPIYVMLLEIQLASKSKATALEKKLKQAGRAMRLDVTLQDISPISL